VKALILGAGEVGESVARRLVGEHADVTLVDHNRARLEAVTEHLDAGHLCGRVSSPKVLRLAGVAEADLVVAVTDTDEVNLLACQFAGLLAPGCTRVARVRDAGLQGHRELMESGGLCLDAWISPRVEASHTMANLVKLPGATEVEEFVDGAVHLVASRLRKASPLVGKTLIQLRNGGEFADLTAVAIERSGFLVPPVGKTVLKADDVVFVMGVSSAADRLPELAGHPDRRVKSVMIFGGGSLGLSLAERLLEDKMLVKVVERDLARCHELADRLEDAVILCGDCTDQDLLIEERIGHIDTFVACTRDDEENILAALLATRLGVKHTIVRENTQRYADLLTTIGIGASVSVSRTAVASILRYARRGAVRAAVPIGNLKAEAMELQAKETSKLVAKPIASLGLPKDLVIGAVVREGQPILPTGDLQILPEDEVVIFSPGRHLKSVQDLVSVSLDFF